MFQMISGKMIDIIGGNQAYFTVYMMYALIVLIALIITLRFKMPKQKIRNEL